MQPIEIKNCTAVSNVKSFRKRDNSDCNKQKATNICVPGR